MVSLCKRSGSEPLPRSGLPPRPTFSAWRTSRSASILRHRRTRWVALETAEFGLLMVGPRDVPRRTGVAGADWRPGSRSDLRGLDTASACLRFTSAYRGEGCVGGSATKGRFWSVPKSCHLPDVARLHERCDGPSQPSRLSRWSRSNGSSGRIGWAQRRHSTPPAFTLRAHWRLTLRCSAS